MSEDFKRFVINMNRQEQKLDERKRRLYNRFFRKSLFYWSSLIVRILYVLLFLIVVVLYEFPNEFRQEKFLNFEVEYSRGGKYAKNVYYLVTDKETYYISKDFQLYDLLKKGDIINVEYNLFNKPIYFKKEEWNIKYGIYKNYIYYYMLLFTSCVTFFFNDGYDSFTVKLLYVFYAIDLISIIVFFVF